MLQRYDLVSEKPNFEAAKTNKCLHSNPPTHLMCPKPPYTKGKSMVGWKLSTQRQPTSFKRITHRSFTHFRWIGGLKWENFNSSILH